MKIRTVEGIVENLNISKKTGGKAAFICAEFSLSDSDDYFIYKGLPRAALGDGGSDYIENGDRLMVVFDDEANEEKIHVRDCWNYSKSIDGRGSTLDERTKKHPILSFAFIAALFIYISISAIMSYIYSNSNREFLIRSIIPTLPLILISPIIIFAIIRSSKFSDALLSQVDNR